MSVVANVAINVDSSNAVSKLRQVQTQATATERAAQSLTKGVEAVNAAAAKTGREMQVAANGMRFFTDAAGRARKENGQFVTTAEAAAAGIRKQGQAAQGASGAVGGLTAVIGKLAIAYAALKGLSFGVQAAAEIEITQKRLETLTGSATTAKQVFDQLQKINLQSPFELKDLTAAAAKLSAFGVSTQDLVGTTEKLGKIAAGTGQSIDGIALAYGQVMVKGRLQGEELLQFQERGIGLSKELQRMLGVSGQEFSKMVEKGQVSSALVAKAIDNMTNKTGQFGSAFANASGTIQAKLSNLNDSFYRAAGALINAFAPALKWLVDRITDVANFFAGVFDRLGRMQAGQNVVGMEMKANETAELARRKKFGLIRNPFDKKQDAFVRQEYEKSLAAQMPKSAVTKPPSIKNLTPAEIAANRQLLTGGGTTGRGKKGKTDAERAAEAAAKLEQQTQDRLRSLARETELIGQITNLKELQSAAEAVGDKELQTRLAGEEQIINIIQQTAQQLDGVTDKRLEQAILGKAQAEILKVQVGIVLELEKVETDRNKKVADISANYNTQLIKIQATTDVQKQALELLEIENRLQEQGIILTEKEKETIRLKIEAINQVTKAQQAANAQAQMEKELFDGIANTVAGSFSQAFDAAINGTKNLGEALKALTGDLLKMISKMLIMYAIGAALKALAGGTNDDKGGILTFLAAAFGHKASNGATFSNGIAAFANGGIVGSPTLFKFADGGATRTGLMGEAGPEAIMPLKRDRSGRLGVALVDSREALGTKQGSSTASDAFSANRESLSNTATLTRERRVEQLLTSGASSTEIKYSRVGSGDLPFVTEQDMLKASRLATQEGAKLGQQRTLAALRNNPSTRRGIGI